MRALLDSSRETRGGGNVTTPAQYQSRIAIAGDITVQTEILDPKETFGSKLDSQNCFPVDTTVSRGRIPINQPIFTVRRPCGLTAGVRNSSLNMLCLSYLNGLPKDIMGQLSFVGQTNQTYEPSRHAATKLMSTGIRRLTSYIVPVHGTTTLYPSDHVYWRVPSGVELSKIRSGAITPVLDVVDPDEWKNPFGMFDEELKLIMECNGDMSKLATYITQSVQKIQKDDQLRVVNQFGLENKPKKWNIEQVKSITTKEILLQFMTMDMEEAYNKAAQYGEQCTRIKECWLIHYLALTIAHKAFPAEKNWLIPVITLKYSKMICLIGAEIAETKKHMYAGKVIKGGKPGELVDIWQNGIHT